MDTEFLAKIVRTTDIPAAERALRALIPDQTWKHKYAPCQGVIRPQINDPEGLLRALSSSYAGPGMRVSYR